MRTILTVISFALIFASLASAAAVTVPEPTSLSLLAVGAVALYGFHRKRK